MPPPRHRAVAANAAERIPIDKQHERAFEVGESCHCGSGEEARRILLLLVSGIEDVALQISLTASDTIRVPRFAQDRTGPPWTHLLIEIS